MARLISCLLLFLLSSMAYAEVHLPNQMDGIFLAQFEGDDSYDPFADYSEFEEAAQEEADLNFFRNGRFFNLGLALGLRSFTGGMSNLYKSGSTFGFHIAYFFDLRFALQFAFLTSDHALTINGPSGTFRANVGFQVLTFNIKYFFNTQNVTRGLADMNPYIVGGISQFSRTFSTAGASIPTRDTAMSFDTGLGIEIPMMRNKMYFGLQATYHIVNFKDEGVLINTVETGPTELTADGDLMHVLGIIGVNF